MLAGVLERLLKSYLSRWLSVTASHLQVLNLGVWSGNVHFEQLHMLTSVLDELQLPLGLGVKLKKGMIGSLQLKCNWTRLTTQPVEILLSDVYLLGEIDPNRMNQTQARQTTEELVAQALDPQVIKNYLLAQKQQIIEAAEQFKSESTAANQSYMSSLTASLVTSILDNLSVTVERIHVCIATQPKADPLPPPPVTTTTATVSAIDSSPSTPTSLTDSISPDLVSPQPLQLPIPSTTTATTPDASSSTASLPANQPQLSTNSSTVPAATPSTESTSTFPTGWALGVILNELSFYTTDKAGAATFVKSTGSYLYKRVKLDGLGVYLSSNATPLPDAAAGSDDYFMRIMAKPFHKSIKNTSESDDDEVDDPDESRNYEESKNYDESKSYDESKNRDSKSETNSDSDLDETRDHDNFQDAREAHTTPQQSGNSPLLIPLNQATISPAIHPQSEPESSSKSLIEDVTGLEYILSPCDATVKLRLTKNSTDASSVNTNADPQAAKLSVSIEVENLQLEFTSKQYEIIQALAANISSSEHALRHAPFIAPRLRPGHSRAVSHAWWQYALQVTRHQCRQRLQQWSPKFIMAYRYDYHAYQPLYQAFISGKATAHQKSEMQRLEDGWDAHHIIMWRSLIQKSARIKEAMQHVSKVRGKKKTKGNKKHGSIDTTGDTDEKSSGGGGSVIGWLGSWLPGGSSTDTDDDTTSVKLSQEEREQILSMLGYDPYASIEQLQSTENTMKIDFTLGKASITLFQATIQQLTSQSMVNRIDPSTLPSFPLAPRSLTQRQPFLHASLDDFQLEVQQTTGGVSVELSLDHLLVEDRMASCERFNILIAPRAHHARRAHRTPRLTGQHLTPRTPHRRSHQQTAIESSPLMLPESTKKTTSFAPSSPEFTSSSSTDPPLLQMRLSYHFPSVHLASSASANQAHVDLWLATQPLDVVHSADVITGLQTFLMTTASATDPDDAGFNVLWQELEVAAMNAFQDLKRRSAAKLDYVLNHHVRIGLDINIQAPTLLIYHHSPTDLGSCLAINLGHVTCRTQEKQPATAIEPEDGVSHNRSQLDSSMTASTWNIGASIEAAVARERAMSGSILDGINSSTTAPAISPEARQLLFYDQFHLTIQNMDVQLIPLPYQSKDFQSPPGSTAFGPQSDPSTIPVLLLPSSSQPTSSPSASPPAPGGGRSSRRGGSRRTWLARRRHLQSRTTRASMWGCGPLIDAFTPTVHIMSSVLPSDTSLPRMKIHAHLPPLKLHLSSAKMRRILDILTSFPSATPITPTPPVATTSNASSAFPRSSSNFSSDSRSTLTGGGGNRRSTSSFQVSKESAMATAAQMLAKEKESKTLTLPPDWVMLNFHLTASQLAIDLSFDCDLPPDQLHRSPTYPSSIQPSMESTIELVSFLLEGIDLNFTQFPYAMSLETQVHGLFVEDCINREHTQFRYLISSGSSPSVPNTELNDPFKADMDDRSHTIGLSSAASTQSAITDLIYLRFRHSTDTSPTAVASTIDSLQVDFNTLQFNFNRSTFQLLLEFLQPALDVLDSSSKPSQPPPGGIDPSFRPSHIPHHQSELSDMSDAETVRLSRSVDFSASQLHDHAHGLSNASSVITNLSASTSSLPPPMSPATTGPTHPPQTPDRNMSTPVRPFSTLSIPTPTSTGPIKFGSSVAPTQQELLSRISEKISNDGEIGSRANRQKLLPSSNSLHIQARINLISLSLNTEKDDTIASIARSEIHGLDVSVKNDDCPCGGCLQVEATLSNLTLFEITTNASDTYSTYSRRSEARSGYLRPPSSILAHSPSNNSLRDSFSPTQPNDSASWRYANGPGSIHARRIASKRHASDTALVRFSFTQHSLLMDGAPSSVNCPIRFRTIRNMSEVPPVDPNTLSYDQTISVNVSSIQVVFVPDFILRLQSYLEESLLKEASDRAAEKAALAFAELKQLAEANCSLLKYTVAIDNPLIFIPHTTMAPTNHPIHLSPSPPGGSPIPNTASPLTPPDTHTFQIHYQQQDHLYDDVRAITDYLVLDLGKISLANVFQLSDERHQLMPPDEPTLTPNSSLLLSPTPRRRRKSLTASGRVPTQQLQLKLSAMNLILASHTHGHGHRRTGSISHARSNSTVGDGLTSSDDAGVFWLNAHKIKIFEDVDVHLNVTLVMLVPHLSFVDVPNIRLVGTLSTIHAHVSEQLLTFLLGVYMVELAPLLTPEPPQAFEPELDEMMEMEFEPDDEDEGQEFQSKSQPSTNTISTPRPIPRVSSTGSVGSVNEAERAAAALAAAEAMASIDEEFDDDEFDATPLPLSHTTETVSMTIDFTFEGVLLDLMLTPPPPTLPQDEPPSHPGAVQRESSGSFLSPSFMPPSHPSASASFQTPSAVSQLTGFTFAPIPQPSTSWYGWSHNSHPSHSFAQVRAQTLALSIQLKNIVQTQLDAESIKSALTSIELSLGHLSLEDVRTECSHPLLKQVIGGHHDLQGGNTTTKLQSQHRAGSVAFDLSQATALNQSISLDSASSPSAALTVLPDLKLKFESLAVECVPGMDESGQVMEGDGAPIKESKTVEMSVDVEFTAPRLVISPNFLSALINFIDAYTDVVNTNLMIGSVDANPNLSSPQPDIQPIPSTSTSTSKIQTRIHARIRDPQVWLMSDAEVSTTTTFAPSPMHQPPNMSTTLVDTSTTSIRPLSCVVLRCNLELTVKLSQSTAVLMTLGDIEALMCYRANQLKLAHLNPLPVPVFQPFAVQLEYQLRNPATADETDATRQSSGGANDSRSTSRAYPHVPLAATTTDSTDSSDEHHLTIDVGRLDSCFSFLQMSSAANIILALVQAIPAKEVADSPNPTKPSSADSVALSPVAFLASFKGVAQLRTPGIHLKLVNDAPGYYVPLLSFSINPFVLSILDASHNESVHSEQLMTKQSHDSSTPTYLPASRFSTGIARPTQPRRGAALLLTTGLQANYYNQQLGEWETFLDTWLFDVRADEQTIMISSKQILELQVTPSCMHALAQGMESLQAHFLSVLSAPPRRSTTPIKRNNQTRPVNTKPAPTITNGPTTVAPTSSDRKASYFRVRNETGSRLRFWSVEVEQSGANSMLHDNSNSTATTKSASAPTTFTVNPNEEQTVALRQYIGVGGFGLESDSSASDEEEKLDEPRKLRWLYRSPMVGLQLEAGSHTDRWNAWQLIHAVPLVASSTEAAIEVSRKSSANQRLHAHANLTLHPLFPSSECDSSPYDLDESPEIAGSVIACHLVSQTDLDGSVAQVLVVSSALLLVNRTFVDIEICLIDTVAEEVLFQCIVHSSQTLHMPVLLVPWSRVKLLLRPSGLTFKKTEWEWSTAGFRLSLLPHEAANHTILKCKPHHIDFPLSPLQSSSHAFHHGSSTDLFCCGLNISSTSASSDIAQTDATASLSQLTGTGLDGSIDPTLYTIALDPPLSFKNLLGCDISYQVTLRERSPQSTYIQTRLSEMIVTGVQSGVLLHRHEAHWYHMDLGASSSAVVTLQLRRTHVDGLDSELNSSHIHTPRSSVSRSTSRSHLNDLNHLLIPSSLDDWSHEWSDEVVIHSTTTAIKPASNLVLKDSEGLRLGIQLDYSASPHQKVKSASTSIYPYAHAGHGLVTASVPYWFSNSSGLPLIYASLDEREFDSIQKCAGQSVHSLQHASQALMDLEGVDELAQQPTSTANTDQTTSNTNKSRSWFQFRDARLEFGNETRSGLQALLDTHEQEFDHTIHQRTNCGPQWKWTPELARRPLDENVFLLNPINSTDQEEEDIQPQLDIYMLPSRAGEKLRAVIRLPNTDWSQPFNVDTVGWDGTLQLIEQPRSSTHTTSKIDQPRGHESAYELPPSTDRPLRVYSLGVSICMHTHLRYHRTKIIQFTPRYVLSNQTLHTLEFRQTGSQEIRTILPKESVPIHWLDQGGASALSLRVGSYGWQWAAKRYGIALESVGVFSVRLRNSHTHDTAVLHVWIKLVGATFEMTILATWDQQQRKTIQPPNDINQLQLSQQSMANMNQSPVWMNNHDLNSSMNMSTSQLLGMTNSISNLTSADDRDLADKMSAETNSIQEPVPYRIENCSLRTLLFHQLDEPNLKQRLLPFQTCPYAWDEPMGRKEIVLFCLSGMGANSSLHDDGDLYEEQRVGSYSLDKIKRYEPVWLRTRSRQNDTNEKQIQDQVIAQVYADGRVRVLKLVELTYANSAGLNPIQASLNAKANDPRQTTLPVSAVGWSVEVRLAGLGLSLITHVQRAGVLPTFAAPISTSISQLRSSSTIMGGATSSASHPLALLGVPYTRQELLYLSIQNIRLRLNESSSSQALKAAIGHIQLDNQLHSSVYPVVLCSVSKPQKSGGWFSSTKRRKDGPPELDLDDDFFHLHPANHSALMIGKGQANSQKDILPCWFSVSLLKSHDRSTSDFLFLPGLAMRMQLLKINIEEKLINHLVRFSELLGPALALMTKPAPVQLPTNVDDLGPHHFSGPVGLERQTSSHALFEIALNDATDLGSSPMPIRSRSATSFPSSELGDDSRSMTPTSFTDTNSYVDRDEQQTTEADDLIHSQQFTGVIGRLSLPPVSSTAPLSSLEYSRVGSFHPASGSVLERADLNPSHAERPATLAAPLKKLERPFILYFQHLFVETIQIQVSMSSSGEQDDPLVGGSSHPLRVLLRAVGATLLNFEDAVLKFGSLDLPDVFASGEELMALVQLHYMKQATRQAYHLLGASDFLGNPAALFGAISTGFGELVYQPVAGLTQSPVGVVTGALGGVRSFLQHAIYGVTSTTKSILSSIGKGLSSASMSEQHRTGTFLRLRELPMRGWRRNGVGGFLVGSFRATLGVSGRLAHSLSLGVDRVRALVNPVPRLLRAREPLFFQSGMKPKLYHIETARFVAEYLLFHPDETFVCCLEQDGLFTPPAIAREKLFGMTLGGHLGIIQTTTANTSIPAPSHPSTPTAAAASTSSSVGSSPPTAPVIRAPTGSKVCMLLTTHTLVFFCLLPTTSTSHRRPAQPLREIPLEFLMTPVDAHPHYTIFTLDTFQGEKEGWWYSNQTNNSTNKRSQRKSYHRNLDGRSLLNSSPNYPSTSMPFPTPSFLRILFPFFFAPNPLSRTESFLVPIHLPQPLIGQLELLSTAAHATYEANNRRARGTHF